MFKATEKMSHPRLGHGLKHWFLLDLASGAPIPAHPGASAFPWEMGWRFGGRPGGVGVEANLSTQQPVEVLRTGRALAFLKSASGASLRSHPLPLPLW